jgi:hypothetical protein
MAFPALTVEHIMPFGKHKGETIGNLLEDNPNYMFWLRANTDINLHDDIHATLDGLITSDRKYRGNQTWAQIKADKVAKGVIDDSQRAEKAAAKAIEVVEVRLTQDQVREQAYAGTWGEW